MSGKVVPRYPIYVPSKGRHERCLTVKFLLDDEVPFHLVVEPQEADEYAKMFGKERILVLPFSNLGQGSIPARNWIKEHATKNGHARHWQLDDNIRKFRRRWKGKRIRCRSGPAMAAMEDFTDRYENVSVSGPNYWSFAVNEDQPFWKNVHVYSAMLINNKIPFSFRGRYNEDTDLCLQSLSNGWCTILFNVFLIEKMWTMTMKGGNTDELYRGDGRLKMARSLERMWPGVVETKRRFKRPQHVIKKQWRGFDTLLKLKSDIDLSNIQPNEYGMSLQEVKPVKSEKLKELLAEWQKEKIM